MTSWQVFLFFSFVLASCFASQSFKVDPNTRKIVDENGRTRIFHGVNAIQKLFPFYPVYDHYDYNYSLCEQDYQDLKSWGFNMIRLYVAWEGFEPEKGQYNMTYLEEIGKIVNMSAQYGFGVLLDAHQDVLAREFCGEGWPSWAVKRNNFPSPLNVSIRFQENGLPVLEDCLQLTFSRYYYTEDVMLNLRRLYTNLDGIRDSFSQAWGQIASFFKDYPNIMGYDLMNEPFASDVYSDPFTYLFTGYNDAQYLLPFYESITKEIRKKDPDTLIFYEPTVHDFVKIGFSEFPDSKDKLVFNFHTYCAMLNGDVSPVTREIHKVFCHWFFDTEMEAREAYADQRGYAMFVSEFGALIESVEEEGQYDLLGNLYDEHLTGWAYWQYKYYDDITTISDPALSETFFYTNGSLQTSKVKSLARPYGHAFCGELKKNSFDPETTTLKIQFTPEKKICEKANSLIFLNEPMYFPNGFKAIFSGFCLDYCSLERVEESYYNITLPDGWAFGNDVILEVLPH